MSILTVLPRMAAAQNRPCRPRTSHHLPASYHVGRYLYRPQQFPPTPPTAPFRFLYLPLEQVGNAGEGGLLRRCPFFFFLFFIIYIYIVDTDSEIDDRFPADARSGYRITERKYRDSDVCRRRTLAPFAAGTAARPRSRNRSQMTKSWSASWDSNMFLWSEHIQPQATTSTINRPITCCTGPFN
jgi:hypothetical protein